MLLYYHRRDNKSKNNVDVYINAQSLEFVKNKKIKKKLRKKITTRTNLDALGQLCDGCVKKVNDVIKKKIKIYIFKAEI